jgi:V/A-type H+/Na+-transporting ATPase subunit E
MAGESAGSSTPQAIGVQGLIDQLKQDGVVRGQQEAESVIRAAKQQAIQVVEDAQREAETLLSQARQQAQQILAGGTTALELASRDAKLKLQESFQQEFQHRFSLLIHHTLSEPDFLHKLILEVARRVNPQKSNEPMQILVGNTTTEDLDRFILGLGADLLREGVTFAAMEGHELGIRVQLVDQDVEIDLTSDTVSALLMKFLTPRFRNLLENR